MTDPADGRIVSLRLRVEHSAAQGMRGREVTFDVPTVRLGRIEDGNDLAIPDPSISRHHAVLQFDASGELVIQDNQSSNGIVVDGNRVERAELRHGQRFSLGTTTLQVFLDPPTPAGPAREPVVDEATVIVADFAELAEQFERPASFEELGESRVLPANQPFLLSDSSSMWLVKSGKVEVFTVGVEKGKPTGARTHFLTVDPGEVFFGLDADTLGFDSGFLAVGKAGSEICRYEIDRLSLYAPVPVHGQFLASAIQRWVTALSRRLTQDISKVPDPELLLRADEETAMPPDVVTTSGNEALWIELPAERFLFDSMGSLSYEAEGVLFPLAPGSWLELLSEGDRVELLPRRTADVIDDSRLWAGLGVFHRLLMECELLNKRLAVVDEFNRLQRKEERARAAREEGIGAIESVLGGTRKFRPTSGPAEMGPIFHACSLVAKALDIGIKKPPRDLEELSFEDSVNIVATTSRFRIRRVALVDDWWNRDQGPLLAQREEGESPVALLPAGSGSYNLIEPLTGVRTKVDEELAATLIPFAYAFYRPFPDGPLDAKKLIHFGVQGLGSEFRAIAYMGILVGLLSTVAPTFTGMVIDGAIPQAERVLLLQLCGGLFMVALGSAAFKVTQNIAMLRLQTRMEYSLQPAVWDRLLDLPVSFFRSFSAGDLADRASAIDRIRAIVAGAGVAAILGSFASLFNVGQMFLYNATLAAVAIGLTVLYVSLTMGCNYLKLKLQREEMHRRGRIAGLVLQLITGVPKLRVSGSEDHAFRAWATDFAAMRRTAFGVGRVGNFMPVLNAGYPVFSSMAIFFTVVKLREKAFANQETLDLTTGDFLAFNAAFGIFLMAMQALGDASVNLMQVFPIYERMKPILEAEPEVDASKAAPPRLRGAIDISHLSFRYSNEGPWILQDLSLEIEAGEFVAFVGGSGSGKSTLMKLMLGFLRPEQGSVYYDGQDLSTLDVRMVRQQIGVVLQESRLLPADIYRNIVGSSSKSIGAAWDAARKAGLADDIKLMPMGMHTYVSEGGGGFSGGQKQRLMIARALVHEPRILFLDEATSALDNRTQATVTESMDRLQTTRVVIAHRLSTIVNADKICYLDQGKIAEMGTYEELMALGGGFADLARRQLS